MLHKKTALILVGAVITGGLAWLGLLNRSGTDEATNLVPPLQRSNEVVARTIDRKRGDLELRAERRATIKGRDAYWNQRLGDVPPGYLSKIKKQADRIPVLNVDKDGGLSDWAWLGPGNIGGRVRAMVIDPALPQDMWLGGVSGGIWRSTNAGSSWTPVNDFMANLAVSCMVMTPDRQYLFAGTGEGFPGALPIPGEGVFRSGDRGQTWQQLPMPSAVNFQWVTRLAVHPVVDGRIFAMTGSRPPNPVNGTLYQSNDDGMSWFPTLSLGTNGYDVKITNITVDGTPWIMAAGNGELFLSTNDGASFTSMVNGAVTTPLPTGAGRIEVAFGTATGTNPVLYASLTRNNGELWRSTNGGNTWQAINTGSNIFLSTTNQGNYDNALWIEPGNPNRVLWGGVDLYASVDGGTSFSKFSKWERYENGDSAHADQHLIVPHPQYSFNTPRVYFGNDGGIQFNEDPWTNGPTSGWTNLANGLGITQFYAGAASPDGSVVMGGAQDNSFLRFNNGTSESWFQQTTGDGAYVAVNPDDPTTIYASTQNLNLLRSRNGGNGYTDIGKHIPDVTFGNRVLFIAPYMLEVNNSNALVAGGKSVWRSTDEGNNWYALRDSIASRAFCSAIEQSTADPSRYYVGYTDGTVSRSVGAAPTWSDIQVAAMPGAQVTDIAVNPTDPDDIIVAFSTTSAPALWRSFDAGVNWIDISTTGTIPLPASAINSVTFHPNNVAWVYVGTDVGVFATEDGGVNWSRTTGYPGSEGPANTKVMDLFWAGDLLYAATYGRGMFRTWPRVTIYVDVANAGNNGQKGTDLNPYENVTQGEISAGNGTNLIIEGGTYDEINGLALNKRGLISGRNGTVVVK